MKDTDLFIEKINDLQDAIYSDNAYRILEASAILRQLLIDGDKSLVNIVNRHYKLKIVFEVGNNPIDYPLRYLNLLFTWLILGFLPLKKKKYR